MQKKVHEQSKKKGRRELRKKKKNQTAVWKYNAASSNYHEWDHCCMQTNLGLPLNRWALNSTLSNLTYTVLVFTLLLHFLTLLFCILFAHFIFPPSRLLSTLFCSAPTLPLSYHFSPLLQTADFYFFLSYMLSLLSGFCLFIPLSAASYFPLTFSSFSPHAFFSLWVFSQQALMAPTLSISFSPLFLIPRLSTRWIQRVLSFFLNGFATLPNPSSLSVSPSLAITLFLVLSFPRRLYCRHTYIMLFFSSNIPPPPHTHIHTQHHTLTFSDKLSLFPLSKALFLVFHST